jgi:hypothetical protein
MKIPSLLTLHDDTFAIANVDPIYPSPPASDSKVEDPPSKEDDEPGVRSKTKTTTHLDSENQSSAAETIPTAITVPADMQADETTRPESPAGSDLDGLLDILGDSWDDMYE